MKINELLTEAKTAKGELQPITVTGSDGKFTVHTDAKSGPTLDAIFKVYKAFDKKRGVTMKFKSGKDMDLSKMLSNRPNGFILIFADPEGAKEKVEAAIEKATGSQARQMKSDAKYKADAPKRAKEKAAYDAVKRKTASADQAEKYGKGTWGRVTYKQEGGDDGYQYVLRVDGKPKFSGLTQREASSRKVQEVDAIAKREKLGKYAELKEDKHDKPEMSVRKRMEKAIKDAWGYTDADFEDMSFADIESIYLDDLGLPDFRK